MKQLFTLFTSLLVTVTFAQQKLIAVKGNVTDAITTTLTDAIAMAQPGDKIYLPGGYFEYTGTINKQVHIIGTGFQDGMNVMGRTTINGSLTLSDLANGSTFEGFYLNDWFIPTSALSNITFKRCNFKGTAVNGFCSINNSYVINCVVRDILAFGEPNTTLGQNNYIRNSFVGYIYRTQNSTVSNCIISGTVSDCHNITVQDNIFGGATNCNLIDSCSAVEMHNNLLHLNCFGAYGTGIVLETATATYPTINSVFVNATDLTFNPSFDYHLTGSYISSSVGIFGGSNPWKVGSLPIIPNIEQNNSYLDVQNQTFKLNVKVVPQTH